jgi:hypothetical protein
MCAMPAVAQTPREIPNDAVTPGAVASTDEADVCGKVDGQTYSKRHRSGTVEASLHCPKGWQADHRVPLGIGGADVVANLWCQPGTTTWNWHDKDVVDTKVWFMTCHQHTMIPRDAQALFLAPADWRVSFCFIFKGDHRCARAGKPVPSQAGYQRGR